MIHYVCNRPRCKTCYSCEIRDECPLFTWVDPFRKERYLDVYEENPSETIPQD